METTKLVAEVRGSRGKGPARRLRSEGKIPAVIYGKGTPATALTLDPKDLVKQLRSEKGRNSLFELAYDGKSAHVMVRDVAIDPVTREAVHVDLFAIDPQQPVEVEVPFVTKGRAAGVVKGGKLSVAFRALPVRCLPGIIPVKIEYDVTQVDLGTTVTVSGLVLPEGVTVTLKPNKTVLGIFEERAVAEEGADAAAPAGKAAPAAAGKAAPAAKPAGKK